MVSVHRIAAWTSLVAFTLGLAVGCNAILGNEEGVAAPEATEAGVDAASTPDTAAPFDAPIADTSFDAAVSCPSGKTYCTDFKACVDPTDPNFGCGNAPCTACNTTHADDVTCAGTSLGIECKVTCSPGFADCDKKPRNGCETDLSQQKTCGSCTNDCGTQLCAAAAGTFSCVSACPPGQQACGSQCVDVASDPNNCSACMKACAAPANASATCANSQCDFACQKLFHKCGSSCAADSDVKQCGASCTDCTANVPANTTASCQNGACVYQCYGGYADCNNSMKDGCEADLYVDPNCGGCGTSCSGTLATTNIVRPGTLQCCNGACVSSGTTCLPVR